MTTLAEWRREHGHFADHRAEQARAWFEQEVREGLLADLARPGAAREAMARLGDQVQAGDISAAAAAAEMLALLGRG